MLKSHLYAFGAFCAGLALGGGALSQAPRVDRPEITPDIASATADSAELILTRFTEAWRGKEETNVPERLTVAFWIEGPGGGDFHVELTNDPSPPLQKGAPQRFDFGYQTDVETLRRIDSGDLSALTAMAQARSSDPTPMRPRMPEGFKGTREALDPILKTSFHFWNRSWPETIRFGEGTGRSVHGAVGTIFYYERGFRSAWFQVKPGMHVNADPRDQSNPFSSLLVPIRGEIQAKFNGEERTMKEGEAIFIPAGMTHEFWAKPDQYAEAVLIMFGEGA
jgi:mannose-6-phosphate isomerase-like protein (cupin superfamily)